MASEQDLEDLKRKQDERAVRRALDLTSRMTPNERANILTNALLNNPSWQTAFDIRDLIKRLIENQKAT